MGDFRRLWIFRVVGGEPFSLTIQGNLPMVHDGKGSTLQCLCTDEQAEKIEDEILKHGCTIPHKNSPRESSEQRQERKNVFAVMGGDEAAPTWPTTACPECAWFSFDIPGMCGAGMLRFQGHQGWPEGLIEKLRGTSKFDQDYEKCPLASIKSRSE